MSNLPSSSPDSPQALREGEAGFWREIERMDKRQVAELLRHTQMERDRAVEERNALRASPSGDRAAVSLSRTAEGKQEDDGLLGNTAAGKSSDPPSTSRRPSEDEINRLEKVAWDANVEHVLIWYRDRIEELEANRGN